MKTKTELENELEGLRDLLSDMRELIYNALEGEDAEGASEADNLRAVLSELEDMIDEALSEEEEEEDEEEEDDEDEERW